MPRYSTEGPITASIRIACGDIRLVAGDRQDATVAIAPSDANRSADVTAAADARVEYLDGNLRVISSKNPRVIGPMKRTGSVQVTIELPAESHVDAVTGLGAIHSEGFLGECRVQTGAGDIRLAGTATLDATTGIGAIAVDHVTGNASCKTGSGSVRASTIDGSATIKNSNGDTWIGDVHKAIKVKASNGAVTVGRARGDVTAATANGDLLIGSVESGTVDLKTALGRIQAGIRVGTAARLDLHTSFGNVVNELDAADRPGPSEATVDITAQTSAGDIVIHRASTDE
jgi:DUF4097 and DUF4098 domain-containing protein YvlB